MKIKELCKNVFEQKNEYDWDYYSCFKGGCFEYCWEGPEDFVKKMFGAGKKTSFWEKLNLSESRYKHMMVAFFLGHFLSKKLIIFQELISNNKDFSWEWFLCCLYHDAFADKERKMRGRSRNNDYTTYVRNYLKNSDEALFNIDIINKYDNYRYKFFDKTRDHGIYAADKLAKKYYALLKSNGGHGYLPNGLRINNDLKNKVYKISQVIACHNIYICLNKEDENKYIKCGLQDLVITQNNSCKMPKGKTHYGLLHFLLCLCDTIEPTKREVDLEKLDIEIDENKIEIKLMPNSVLDYIYAKNQFELNSWLNYIDVSIEKSDEGYFIKYEINNQQD